MTTRRRFLQIAAAACALPAHASVMRKAQWQGVALGADCEITLEGPEDLANAALSDAVRMLREIEALFSLYDPQSQLVHLNSSGTLQSPDTRFVQLLDWCDRVHSLTHGAFDPSVQPVWKAIALGGDAHAARAQIGWDLVQWSDAHVHLGSGQELTFNGIAQGCATDLVRDVLATHGLHQGLINIGEYRALGGPWRVGLSDPQHGLVATRTLEGRAVATSSPGALRLSADAFHILDPSGSGAPQWSTVSVEAQTAVMADGLSTALCLMTKTDAEQLVASVPGLYRITLVDHDGNVSTLT